MLENLDSVEWDKLTHSYGVATQVPHILKLLIDAKTDNQFQEIYSELMNQINHQASIYSATAPTLKFLVQILSHTHSSFRKILNCVMFGEILRNTQIQTSQQIRPRFMPLSITSNRIQLDIYDAIASGLHIYLHFLTDDDPDVRTAGIYVLSFLVEQHEKSIPAILECIENTPHQWLQAGSAWAFAKLSYYTHQDSDDCRSKLLRWIQDGDSLHLRFSAAYGFLLINPPFGTGFIPVLPEIVVETILKSVKTKNRNVKPENTDKMIGYMRSEMLPFIHYLDIIADYCHKISIPQLWLAIVQNLDLSPSDAHRYCREMLDITFLRQTTNKFGHYWDNQQSLNISLELVLTYEQGNTMEHYRENKPLTENQELVLQAIVDCEPFWKIPTNLFSFYYGLPDSRDELRNLAYESQ